MANTRSNSIRLKSGSKPEKLFFLVLTLSGELWKKKMQNRTVINTAGTPIDKVSEIVLNT